MKGWNALIIVTLCLLLLVYEVGAHEETKLEHKPERLDDSPIETTSDFSSYQRLIVSPSNPTADFTSIQDAIDVASNGATIYVQAGQYREVVNIYKKIYLIGEDSSTTLISPSSTTNGFALKISAEHVLVKSFHITNYGSGLYTTGIKITASHTTIQDCRITDTPVGIAVWSSYNTFEDCEFYRCEDEGIALLGSESMQCDANTMQRCTFENNGDGIELQHSSHNLIEECTFQHNAHAGIDGIGSQNDDNTIRECVISSNEGYGVYFAHSKGNTLEHCTIIDNTIMTSSSTATTLSYTSFDSLYLTDASSITIHECPTADSATIRAISSQYEIQEDTTLVQSISSLITSLRTRLHSLLLSLLEKLPSLRVVTLLQTLV